MQLLEQRVDYCADTLNGIGDEIGTREQHLSLALSRYNELRKGGLLPKNLAVKSLSERIKRQRRSLKGLRHQKELYERRKRQVESERRKLADTEDEGED